MENLDIVVLLTSFIPAAIIAYMAYSFFKTHLKNENNRRNFQLVKENKKELLPIRLQAYERIILLMERINPNNLIDRIKPIDEDKLNYCNLLSSTIEQEFTHNLSQQIYLSEESWSVILSSKNATVQLLHETVKQAEINTSQEFREAILKKLLKTTPPSAIAISFVKTEVQKLM